MSPSSQAVLHARSRPNLLTEREAWLLGFIFDAEGLPIPGRRAEAALALGVGRERVRQIAITAILRASRGQGVSREMLVHRVHEAPSTER